MLRRVGEGSLERRESREQLAYFTVVEWLLPNEGWLHVHNFVRIVICPSEELCHDILVPKVEVLHEIRLDGELIIEFLIEVQMSLVLST